jgi:nucleoid-associated protein YgaU
MTFDAGRRVGLLPMACPFLAFADARDYRSAEPDHRHRCYAEQQPAPRALAHQSRYCLSPGFASCPIFQDWAVREAAQVSESASDSLAAAPAPGAFFDEPTPAAETMDVRPFREPEPEVVSADEPGPDEEESWVAAAPGRPLAREWDRPRRREAYPSLRRTGGATQPLVLGLVGLAVVAGLLFLLPSLLSAFFGGGEEPSPTPTATAIGTPALSPTAPPPTAEPTQPEETTPPPGPTPLVYVVQRGDTLYAIAQRYDITLRQLLDANPQIEDPAVIKVGQEIIIPTLPPTEEP